MRIYVKKEIVHILHRHLKILLAQFVWWLGFTIKFGGINSIVCDFHENFFKCAKEQYQVYILLFFFCVFVFRAGKTGRLEKVVLQLPPCFHVLLR